MLFVKPSSAYKKAYKRLSKSGKFPFAKLEAIIHIIRNRGILDRRCRDHELSGKLAGNRECHIESNLLLIYKIEEDILVLQLVNLGSHSGLFD